MFQYSINLLWSDEDQGYIALVPEFKNLSAYGETPEEALKEARILIEEYIEIYKEEGIPIPQPVTMTQFIRNNTILKPAFSTV
jgi:predicted RNase H-like HicB family nuclease